ncbi:hypothetical protein L596_017629 [Steinernema carpocapsae]|uniref:Uncharacterized protein n=1 Tax=Steinernema carpocapsae TaxID=34508 RepID=A0A4U5N2N4_STECR|nr:hypothetical protein L596_017629 [Steinernema carpocapsae]
MEDLLIGSKTQKYKAGHSLELCLGQLLIDPVDICCTALTAVNDFLEKSLNKTANLVVKAILKGLMDIAVIVGIRVLLKPPIDKLTYQNQLGRR